MDQSSTEERLAILEAKVKALEENSEPGRLVAAIDKHQRLNGRQTI